MVFVEEEQAVNQLAGPVADTVTVHAVCPAGQRFIRPAIAQGIEQLVHRNGYAFAIPVLPRHQAATMLVKRAFAWE